MADRLDACLVMKLVSAFGVLKRLTAVNECICSLFERGAVFLVLTSGPQTADRAQPEGAPGM